MTTATIPFVFNAASPIVKGASPSEMFQFSLVPKTTASTGSGSASTLHDLNIQTVAGASNNVFQCVLTDSLQYQGTILVNNTPAFVGNIAPGQIATFVSAGTASITATNPTLGTMVLSQAVSQSGSSQQFTSYITGSLAQQISSAIDSTISGKTWGSTTVSRYTSFTTTTATANSSLWCSSLVDTTGIPFSYGSPYGASYVGALISPNHILFASHASVNNGTLVYFLGNDSVVYSGKVITVASVAGTDITVAYLNTAAGAVAINSVIPTSKCKPFSFLPTNFALASGSSYLASLNQATGIQGYIYVPVMYRNQYNEILLMDLTSFPSTGECTFSGCAQTTPVNRTPWSQSPAAVAAGRQYTYGPIVNDSGSPVFTVIPGDATKTPCLFGTWHTGNSPAPGAGTVPNVAAYVSQIATAMQSSAIAGSAGTDTTAYTPTIISLSGFTTYT